MKHILVIEDDDEIIALIAALFENIYSIDSANDGVGLAKAIISSPDLVILDGMMYPMNGVEVARELRQQTHTKHIPILVMTAYPEMLPEFHNIGIRHTLSKPFHINDLEEKVKELIGTP